jgi:hypothetical protein
VGLRIGGSLPDRSGPRLKGGMPSIAERENHASEKGMLPYPAAKDESFFYFF